MNITQRGLITSGEYLNWEILVDNDQEGSTGGFFIYLKNPENNQGFDYWCENKKTLLLQLSEFDIEWS